MTKETLARLQKLAARQERLDYERDVLMLKSRRDGDRVVEIAIAAGLSRATAYRVLSEAEVQVDLAQADMGMDEAWALLERATTWDEYVTASLEFAPKSGSK